MSFSSEENIHSPSSSMYFQSKQRDHKSTFAVSEKKAIKIETKTSTKKIYIEWKISKRSIDIASLSPKGEKKGVIAASVKYDDIYTFNLELCVPGWRRSQFGFSAFYLTVPRKNNIKQNKNGNEEEEDNRNINNNKNDFVAKYTVSFGQNQNVITRMSSIRNDFDLGVGFPNFSEITTLIESIHENELIFKIEVEIFESQSIVNHNHLSTNYEQQNAESIAAKLISKMYHKKLNCDAMITTNYLNKQKNTKKPKLFKVHKCVLTAASPVFCTLFKHKSHGNTMSFITMNQWNVDIILTMIKFLYFGKIILDHNEENLDENLDENQDEDEEEKKESESLESLDSLNSFDSLDEEEIKYKEEEDDESIKGTPDNTDDEIANLISKCCQDSQRLFELFHIAECYEIDELLVACCRKLHSYITLETCCIALIYLDKYTHLNGTKYIKNSILQFMVENIKLITNSNGYRYLLQHKPRLLDELIDKITQNE